MRITIAGASGYIGTNLIKKLNSSYQIKGLSRQSKTSVDSHITWQETDLFSLTSTNEALKDTDVAIYLVHSMLPSSRLFQGSFHDTDLMLADNFIYACKKNKVKQIIYLGGIVPEGYLSKHLESRKEVEEVLKSSEIPCTIFRAGLVVGNGGSSFEILKNLVINLPTMILPKWTKSNTPIIYLEDLTEMIKVSINNSIFFEKTINAICGKELTYQDLIKQTVKHLNKKILLIPVPINYTSFSKLWVTIFGQSKYELTSPLIDSLLCDFSGLSPSPLIENLITYKTYQSMLPHIESKKITKKKSKVKVEKNNVRSIQRLVEKKILTAEEAANLYTKWLPEYMKSIIRVEQTDKRHVTFKIFGLKSPLLILEYIPTPQINDRVKFHVVGGFLSKTTETGWLEFRSIANGRFLLASINEFVPALPWYVYKFSQAPLHKLTMNNFGKFLQQKMKSTNE